MSDLYYIQDTRQVIGNCMYFWRPEGAGYTCELDKAGKFSREEAESICRNRRSDAMWPVELIDEISVRHARMDHLRMHAKKGCSL